MTTDPDYYRLGVLADADREHAQAAELTDAVSALADLAAPLWRLGDGYGGWVYQVLAAAFNERGLPCRPAAEPRPRKDHIASRLRTAVYERDGYRCVDCGDWHDLTCDHVVPESRGGPTTFDNLATRCRPCNSRKGIT